MFRLLLIIFLIFSCSRKEEEVDEIPTAREEGFYLSCVRWFDRDIYFAFQDNFDNKNNNEFDKLEFRRVLDNIQENTKLGKGHFRYSTVTETILPIEFNSNLPEHEQKTAVLFYGDQKFDEIALEKFGGVQNLEDPNAMILLNPYFKRKFIMILRSSCFGSSGVCVGEEAGQSTPKVTAFVNRQFGRLFGITTRNCTSFPNDIMCIELRESQGDSDQLFNHYGRLNERLETILLNENFFNDFSTKGNCISSSYMDKEVYFGFADVNPENNNSFHKNIVRNCLDEISCGSILGCDYFNYKEEESANLEFTFELVNNGEVENKSFIQILDDSPDFGELFSEAGGSNDPNAIFQINAAKKDEFRIAFRSSCFDSDNKCIGKEIDLIIPTENMCSLIARQVGYMVGMENDSCLEFPSSVMCNEPSINQWNDENKNKWLRRFDNRLEVISNDPNFYFNFGNEVGDGQI